MQKKKHPTFAVPNYGAKSRKRVKSRWRKQRGIDNKKRIKRSGYGAEPNIGYKNAPEVRHLRPDGTMENLVHNEAEMKACVGVPGISVRLSSTLSKRKRAIIGKMAEDNGIRVVNW